MTGTKKLRNLFVCLAMGAALLSGQALAQDSESCYGYSDTIIFGEQDWDSAQVNNAIARFVLEEGFGCSTDIIPGSTVPMQQGLIRGDIDVLTEIWLDNPAEFLPGALESGDIVDLGVIFDDGQQGWLVPRYMVEGDPERGIEPVAPDLRTVEDIAQYAHLFQDPEQPNMGRFHNCIIGWVCEEINNGKLRAYGLDEHFVSFPPGTGVALVSSLQAAYAQGEPWFGYYWSPTWVLGQFDMIMLDEPEYSDQCWDHLNANLDDPEEACEYPASVVIVGVSSQFAEEIDPAILDFLSSFELSSALVSEALAYMQQNDAFPEEAAEHFLESQQDLWTEWVPADVAQRVQSALR